MHGRELWKYDATGPKIVADINPTGDSSPEDLIKVGGTLYFTADDGIHGRQLWMSDVITGGTTQRVLVGSTGNGLSSSTWFAYVGGTLFLDADEGVHGIELWAVTPTPAPLSRAAPAATNSLETSPSVTSNALIAPELPQQKHYIRATVTNSIWFSDMARARRARMALSGPEEHAELVAFLDDGLGHLSARPHGSAVDSDA